MKGGAPGGSGIPPGGGGNGGGGNGEGTGGCMEGPFVLALLGGRRSDASEE